MARVYRGHPFAVVPGVVTDLCRERVIVTDYVEAMRFTEFKDTSSQAQRDRAAEIIVRFYLNGPMRHRLLNGDPHPGNTLFLPDGRVAFLDFGFFKRMGDDEVRHLVKTTRALHENDPLGLLEIVAELGALPADPALAQPFYENYEAIFGWLLDVVTELGALPADPSLAQPFFDGYDAIFGWLLVEEPLTADASKTADMMRHYTKMRGAEGFDRLTVPAEHFVLMRAIFLLIGLLGQLEATNTWFEIAREWLFAEPPSTELGRLEEEFFAGRYDYRTEVAA
jgi:hypothetical protein